MTTAPAPDYRTTVTLDPETPSVGHMLRRRVGLTPDRRAFSFPTDDDTWDSVTWAELGRQAAEVGAGLMSLGVDAEQRVAIASTTRYEWVLANYGIMDASAATVTVYPTTVADDVAFILHDSETQVVFAEDANQLAKITALWDGLPQLHHIILLTGGVPTGTDDTRVITLAELRGLGARLLADNPTAVDDRVDATRLEHLATLIYTSGTTGRPKGVRLPHRVWVFEAATVDATSDAAGGEPLLTIDDKQYLWLPLAHVMGKLFMVIPLHVGFETAVDGRIDHIVDNLAVVKPTFMASAPRVFEKAHSAVESMMRSTGGVTLSLYRWALRTCGAVADADHDEGSAGAWTRLQAKVADRLVMAKIRERFGSRIRFFVSGSAALNRDVCRWFSAVGMPVLEGYGMTETSAGTCLTLPQNYRTGFVGRPLEGLEAKIADDGELLVRGPSVMDGYHNNPTATAEALEPDGWLHTGDIGEMDDEGRVRITDRKKELFKTSNGKYVAPAQVESTFKGLCPLASQLVVVGDGRNFVSALVTLDEEALGGWAEKNGLTGTYAELTRTPKVTAAVQGYIDALNSRLNRWEQIKKFTVLPRDLTVDRQEITPTLKLRRKVITGHFSTEIEAMYG
jgi:long-chain acyl-CoA synthetase